MNSIGNYTVIYGNMIYTVNEVDYRVNGDRRGFYKKNNEGQYSNLILSVPSKGTVVIKNGEGVSMTVNEKIQVPVDNSTEEKTKNVVVNNTTNEVGAFVAGAVVGGILF